MATTKTGVGQAGDCRALETKEVLGTEPKEILGCIGLNGSTGTEAAALNTAMMRGLVNNTSHQIDRAKGIIRSKDRFALSLEADAAACGACEADGVLYANSNRMSDKEAIQRTAEEMRKGIRAQRRWRITLTAKITRQMQNVSTANEISNPIAPNMIPPYGKKEIKMLNNIVSKQSMAAAELMTMAEMPAAATAGIGSCWGAINEV